MKQVNYLATHTSAKKHLLPEILFQSSDRPCLETELKNDDRRDSY